MQYKTIVFHLLEQRPELQAQLQQERMLLPTLERYASELKASHETWKTALSEARPGSNEKQIASEALEIALKELEDSLPTTSSPDENDPLSLEDAMTYIRRNTPPA